MAVTEGAKSAYQLNTEGILVRDVSSQLYRVNPNANPFQTFMRVLGAKKEAKSTKVEWYKDSLMPIEDTAHGALTTETTVNVHHGDYFRAGTVFVIPRTGEQIKVTSVSTNALTVLRGWGETSTSGGIADDEPLLIISNANAESSGVPTIKSVDLVSDYNYMQIIKTPYGASGTAKAVSAAGGTYGGDNFSNQKLNKSIEHLRSIELQLLFGERKEDHTSDSAPIRSCGGARVFITENVTAINGALTEAAFKAWIRELFNQGQGSDQRILFCAPLFAEAISYWAQGKVQTRVDETKYGMAVTYYFSNFGTLVIKPHWLFSTGVYAQQAYAIDPQYAKYRYLPGRDTQEQLNVHTVGTDQVQNQFFTEFSFELAAPEVHGALTGVTSYS